MNSKTDLPIKISAFTSNFMLHSPWLPAVYLSITAGTYVIVATGVRLFKLGIVVKILGARCRGFYGRSS